VVRRGPNLPQYCLNCTKIGKLILRKIIEIVATRCHILKLKCTKFAPRSPAALKGPTSKGRKRRKDGKEGTGERMGRGVEIW